MSVCVTDFQTLRPEEPLRVLDERASSLKKILSRIPDEIYDRKRFLETIKYIISFTYMFASYDVKSEHFIAPCMVQTTKALRHGSQSF